MVFTIRNAVRGDIPAITSIYNYYVANSTATFDEEPHSLEMRTRWFEQHGPAHPILVAEGGGEILGWASISPFSDKLAYRYTVENSIYVRSDLVSKGIGVALMDELITRARAAGHHRILAKVVSDNQVSVNLHRRFGFRDAGRLDEVGFKFGKWVDVTIMLLSL